MTELNTQHPVAVAIGLHQSDKHWRRWEGNVEEFVAKFFTAHDVGNKDGLCITQGPLVDTQRISNDVKYMTIVMGDVDTGESGDSIQARVEAAGLAAIMWTTHSHMKGETEIAQSVLDKFAKDNEYGDLVEAAKEYLAVKKGVVESLVQTITNVTLIHRRGGVKYIISHDPMPRWRVLCFLEKPFNFSEEGSSQKERIDEWKRRYLGFAEKLGLTIDEKCKDPARLMFTPRRPKDVPAVAHEIRFIEGRLVTIDDMPIAMTAKERERAAAAEADALVSFGPAGPAAPVLGPADATNFVTKNLKVFLAMYGRGFLAKTWLASVTEPRRIVDEAKTEFECPLDEMHSNAGDPNDKAFFAVDAEPLSEPPTGWGMYCGHATCSAHTGGDRAKYLDAACVKYGVNDALELKEFVDPGFAADVEEAPQFTRNDNGGVKTNDPHNIYEVMRVERIGAEHDGFAATTTLVGVDERRDGKLTDALVRGVRFKCRYPHNFWPTPDATISAIHEAGSDNYNDPLRGYIENLPGWDGVPRIETVLIDHAGAVDTPITREFTRTFFMGLVARAIRPGCKFDYALILEGPQGIGKSTFLRSIMPKDDWFADSVSAKDDDKVILEKTGGKWLIEIAEFAGMKFAEVEHVKAMLTRQVDEARMAYGRETTSRPRRFVFAITTNKQDYLRDTTGNRRYMPVWCEKPFDLDTIEKFRNQYFAEALRYLEEGQLPMVRTEFWSLAAEAQAERLEDNEYLARLAPHFALKAGRVRASDVYDFLELANSSGVQFQQKRVSECLEGMGWRKCKRKFGGHVLQAFMRLPKGWRTGSDVRTYLTEDGATVTLPDVDRGPSGVGWVGGLAVHEDGTLAGPIPVEGAAAEPPKKKGILGLVEPDTAAQ